MKFLRSIARYKLYDHEQMTNMRTTKYIEFKVDYKCRSKQHLLRMNSTCTPKSVYEHIPTGRRKCTLTKEKTDTPMPMKKRTSLRWLTPCCCCWLFTERFLGTTVHKTVHILFPSTCGLLTIQVVTVYHWPIHALLCMVCSKCTTRAHNCQDICQLMFLLQNY